MQIAYLTKDQRVTHSILVARDEGVDQTGLLKARTYLAFLQARRRLKAVEKEDYSQFYFGVPCSLRIESPEWERSEVLAAVPYYPFQAPCNQPGIAYVKTGLDNRLLFNQVYLRASMLWLEANPHKLKEIEEQFAKLLQAV